MDKTIKLDKDFKTCGGCDTFQFASFSRKTPDGICTNTKEKKRKFPQIKTDLPISAIATDKKCEFFKKRTW